jgi:Tc toxin complex TcA C-terminal TcB-binding domain
VEFLANKFTSAELYSWMSGILGGAYNYILQQATAMAQLAQYELAFERQESPPSFIKADYWEATDDQAQPAGSQSTPDRQGLTGSIRLLQDITRLDQFAFDTNRRKLQLSQTFSLARLAPVEFQRFRETGVLPFATPMALFDQGFPGH